MRLAITMHFFATGYYNTVFFSKIYIYNTFNKNLFTANINNIYCMINYKDITIYGYLLSNK